MEKRPTSAGSRGALPVGLFYYRCVTDCPGQSPDRCYRCVSCLFVSFSDSLRVLSKGRRFLLSATAGWKCHKGVTLGLSCCG